MGLRYTAVVIGVLLTNGVLADDWPQWRGPTAQGHATGADVPLEWNESTNVRWKTKLRGRGWSSPVILGDQVWLTTAETVAATEAEKEERKKSITNSQPVEIVARVNMSAICVDRQTGEIVHDIYLLSDEEPDPIHVDNSYATPTPVIEAGRLYCYFGTHGVACLDTNDGKVLWTDQSQRLNHENGPGSTPVIFEDLMIFHCDGSDVQYIVALNKNTGEVVWKTDRSGQLHSNPQLRKSYCTPLLLTVDDKVELISPAADWLYGYDPRTGEERWKLSFDGLGFSNAALPVYDNGMLYIFTGFMKSRLLAVDYASNPSAPSIAWTYLRQVPKVASPMVVGDLLFMISDNGVATCLNSKTGEELWQQRVGGNFWSSPIHVDGHIIFSSKEGVSTVIKASDKFEIVAKNELDTTIMASPAVVDDVLFIRTGEALYAIAKE